MQLPLFPLPTVVMPGGILPLRLFEPRYIGMVKQCFREGTGFGVCLAQEEPAQPTLPYPQGTEVEIFDFDQGKDGLLHISTRGVKEFIVDSYEIQDDGLLIGQVSPISPTAEAGSADEENAPVIKSPIEAEPFHELADKLRIILDHLEPHIRFDEHHLDDRTWVCHRLLELLPLEASLRYEMLKVFDTDARLQKLNALEFRVAAK